MENYEIRKNEVRSDSAAPAADERKNTVVPKLQGKDEKEKKEKDSRRISEKYFARFLHGGTLIGVLVSSLWSYIEIVCTFVKYNIHFTINTNKKLLPLIRKLNQCPNKIAFPAFRSSQIPLKLSELAKLRRCGDVISSPELLNEIRTVGVSPL